MSQLTAKPSILLCAQRRLRPTWAFAQSDQSLLYTQWEGTDPNFLYALSQKYNQTEWAQFIGFVTCTSWL